MSKIAVFLLLFFITATIFIEPLISKGLTQKDPSETLNNPANSLLIISGDSVLAVNYISLEEHLKEAKISPKKVVKKIITAYTSSPEETDDTPFITAAGTYVRYGVAAANFLPLGTHIRLPKLFGNQIFIVEDRLHERYNNRVDIWMPAKEKAIDFGIQVGEIEIL
jgi:3D (Asp-Asp-Asp) domain-containing protein